MNSIFLLIPIAIVFVIIAVALFFWALRNNQYEDLDREAYNILFDDDNKPISDKSKDTSEINSQSKPENNISKHPTGNHHKQSS